MGGRGGTEGVLNAEQCAGGLTAERVRRTEWIWFIFETHSLQCVCVHGCARGHTPQSPPQTPDPWTFPGTTGPTVVWVSELHGKTDVSACSDALCLCTVRSLMCPCHYRTQPVKIYSKQCHLFPAFISAFRGDYVAA